MIRHGTRPTRPMARRRTIATMPSWEPSPSYDVRGELRTAVEALGDLRAVLNQYPLTNAEPLTLHLRALRHVVRACAAYRDETGDDDE